MQPSLGSQTALRTKAALDVAKAGRLGAYFAETELPLPSHKIGGVSFCGRKFGGSIATTGAFGERREGCSWFVTQLSPSSPPRGKLALTAAIGFTRAAIGFTRVPNMD